MKLIAILLALVLERALSHVEHWREADWFGRYVDWLRARFGVDSPWDGSLGVIALLVAPLVVVGLLQWSLWLILFGLPGFLFGIAVLAFCLGPRQLDPEVEAFVAAMEQGDEVEAREQARRILGTELPEGLPLNAVAADGVLVRANERVFAVIFWFMLLGALGAVLYRGSWMLKRRFAGEETGLAEAARRLQGLLDWIPARLVALGYALTGHFEASVSSWHTYRDRWGAAFEDSSQGILFAAGNGALGVDVDTRHQAGADSDTGTVEAAQGLVWRTLVVWLVVVALVTLAGWIV